MLTIAEFNNNLFSKLKDKVTLKKYEEHYIKNIRTWKLQNIQDICIYSGLQEVFKNYFRR